MRSGVFPGTFDPVTEGHLDLIHRSRKVLDRVVIGVAEAHHKDTLFDLEERKRLIESSVGNLDGVQIVTFRGLLVDFVLEQNAEVIIRGLRFVSDFEYEFQLALMNRRLKPELETLFFMPSAKYSYLNSSVIKEVARLGGDVSGLVPPAVVEAMRKRYAE